jgi:hypothetical protein
MRKAILVAVIGALCILALTLRASSQTQAQKVPVAITSDY